MVVTHRSLALVVLLTIIGSVLQGCEDESQTQLTGVPQTGSGGSAAGGSGSSIDGSNASASASSCAASLEAANARIQELEAQLGQSNSGDLLNIANARIKELEAKQAQLEANIANHTISNDVVLCSSHCTSMNVQGRWSFGGHGHLCPDTFSGTVYCKCSHLLDKDAACGVVTRRLLKSIEAEGETVALSGDNLKHTSFTSGGETSSLLGKPAKFRLRHRESEQSLAVIAAPTVDSAAMRRLYTPAETVENFCNTTGLALMHGQSSSGSEDDPSELNQLESSLLADVSKELESNNVDKVARDIFSFYICVRWVPDPIFWHLARQELAADLLKWGVDASNNIDHAISELYQNYKFVPLLCSKNLEVFSEKDDEDDTYFRRFKKDIAALSAWLQNASNDEVSQHLKDVDEVFCGTTNMNDPGCNTGQAWKEWTDNIASKIGINWFSGESKTDKWEYMAALFKKFQATNPTAPQTWGATFNSWKQQFPYHSFVHKPEGMPSSSSPESDHRYLVCFGKRIASELHRRPHGQHIMTDQNNVGCHGFWTTTEVKDMLNKMVALWKPPTCQLSEMVFSMKKQILQMYAQLNERLFDALPSMVEDDNLLKNGLLEAATAGPPPFSPGSLNGFVDAMRVQATKKQKDPAGCCDATPVLGVCNFGTCTCCSKVVNIGELGSVQISDGALKVKWDGDAGLLAASADELQIVPKEWTQSSTASQVYADVVAGIASVTDYVTNLWDGMHRTRYKNLASLMSGSTSKWVVCPIDGSSNLTELDSQLGVEDAAFQDHQKEAYSKWTGYEAKVPGEECVEPDFINMSEFPGCKICEISELHADHLEKYTRDDGALEDFLCPLKHSLPASEQLTIFQDKGECILKMTPDQQQHFQWPYNGDYPARKQYDKKPNVPNWEYELIQLTKVPEAGTVSYARTCSPEENIKAPRFCKSAEIVNVWDSAAQLAETLGDAVEGSLGISASSLANSLAFFQNAHSSDLGDSLKQGALTIADSIWDGLTGAGRLLESAGSAAVSHLTEGLPGASDRNRRIEEKFFGSDQNAGNLLHTISFQRPIGKNGQTSNSKERYQRYVMTCPCPKYDPAVEFASTKKWNAIVSWMVNKALDVSSAEKLLEHESVRLSARGEGILFHRNGVADPSSNTTWWDYKVAMKVMQQTTAVTCQRNLLSCSPSTHCETSGFGCALKTQVSNSGWWEVSSGQLEKVLVPTLTAGAEAITDIKGIVVTIYCGKKDDFGEKQGSEPAATPSMLECLKAGVESNARLRATSPWKLYFPDEVVAMAIFSKIDNAACKVDAGAEAGSEATLCGSATKDGNLDDHLSGSSKTSQLGQGTYQGLRTGVGWPKGAVAEVVMRPEDILQAAGVISS